jgi:prevent-host-death family protein
MMHHRRQRASRRSRPDRRPRFASTGLTGGCGRFRSIGQSDWSNTAMKARRSRQLAEEAPGFGRGTARREIPASEAKAHFSELLDAVERGETIAITRHGRRIARLVPEADRRRQEIEEAIADMKALAKERREKFGPVSVEEIISSIHEGHKY